MENFTAYLHRTRTERGLVSREVFESSGRLLSSWSSWALWGATTYDLTVFEPATLPWDRLRCDIFLLGGNTGLFNGGKTTAYSNFHTRGHAGDTKLRRAVEGTPLSGAFMTDVIKDYPTADSSDLMKDIAAGRVDMTRSFVEPLMLEFETLNAPADAAIVLMGRGTETLWNTVTAHPSVPRGLVDDLQVYGGLDHYTTGNFTEQIQDLLARPTR